MRRLLWITTGGISLLLLVVGIIYVANPFSVRTWILAKSLRSPLSSVREAAAEALAARDPEEAVELFVDARADAAIDDPWYGESYWWFALLPPELAENLAGMLEDPDTARAAAAAEGFGVLVHENEDHDFSPLLPALFRALQKSFCMAAYALCQIGPEDGDMTTALLHASREGCPGVLLHLHDMELSEEQLDELLDSLAHEDVQLRRWAALALGSRAAYKDRIGPRLVATLGDPNDVVTNAVLSSLKLLGQTDPATIREVTALLGREAVRMYAVEFLAGSTSTSPEALAVVRAALRNSAEATEFLDALGNAPPETISADLIPDLLRLCREGADLDQRTSAVELLGSMGPAAKSAVPAIEEILAKNEDEDSFEWAARAALESIQTAE